MTENENKGDLFLGQGIQQGVSVLTYNMTMVVGVFTDVGLQAAIRKLVELGYMEPAFTATKFVVDTIPGKWIA